MICNGSNDELSWNMILDLAKINILYMTNKDRLPYLIQPDLKNIHSKIKSPLKIPTPCSLKSQTANSLKNSALKI